MLVVLELSGILTVVVVIQTYIGHKIAWHLMHKQTYTNEYE